MVHNEFAAVQRMSVQILSFELYTHCTIAEPMETLQYVYNKCYSRRITMYMNITGIPAEFKHIDKRRRTYNNECRQSLRMNAGYITIEIYDLFIEMLHRMHC